MVRYARLNDPSSYVRARIQAALYYNRHKRKNKGDALKYYSIVAWGDSLTQGAGASSQSHSYVSVAQSLFSSGRTVVNKGIGGQTATQIAARQGGQEIKISTLFNQIPALKHTSFNFTFDSGTDGFILRVNDGKATINSVNGQLVGSNLKGHLQGFLKSIDKIPQGWDITVDLDYFSSDNTLQISCGFLTHADLGGVWNSNPHNQKITGSGHYSLSYIAGNNTSAFGFLIEDYPTSPKTLTIDNVAIKASEHDFGIPITTKNVNILYNSGSYIGTSVGSINGQKGVMSTDPSGEWTFKRSDGYDAVPVPSGSLFIPDDAEKYRNDIAWIWAGNNGITSNQSTVNEAFDAIDKMIYYLDHDRYLVISTLTRSTDSPAVIKQRLALNLALKENYGDRYVDVLTVLRNSGNGSPEDNADIAAGYTPRSLRTDDVHLNDAGYNIVGHEVYKASVSKWNGIKGKEKTDVEKIAAIKDIIFLHTNPAGLLFNDQPVPVGLPVAEVVDLGEHHFNAVTNNPISYSAHEVKDNIDCLYFDGIQSRYRINFQGNWKSSCSIFMAVLPDTTKNHFILVSDYRFFAVAAQNNSNPDVTSFPLTKVHVDNGLPAKDRGDLYAKTTSGKWCLVEIRNIDLSVANSVAISGLGDTDPYWIFKGWMADIIIIPTYEITPDTNRLIMNYYKRTYGMKLMVDTPLLTSENRPIHTSDGKQIFVLKE